MADLITRLRNRRATIEERLATVSKPHTVSVARYQLKRAVEKAILSHATGDILEAGSGRSPYGQTLEMRARSVATLDVESRHGGTGRRCPLVCGSCSELGPTFLTGRRTRLVPAGMGVQLRALSSVFDLLDRLLGMSIIMLRDHVMVAMDSQTGDC